MTVRIIWQSILASVYAYIHRRRRAWEIDNLRFPGIGRGKWE